MSLNIPGSGSGHCRFGETPTPLQGHSVIDLLPVVSAHLWCCIVIFIIIVPQANPRVMVEVTVALCEVDSTLTRGVSVRGKGMRSRYRKWRVMSLDC